jgi:hypothetical protein
MRLSIRTSTHQGRKQLVLCDENGVMLPSQHNTTVISEVDKLTTFTVTFNVTDGVVAFEPHLEPMVSASGKVDGYVLANEPMDTGTDRLLRDTINKIARDYAKAVASSKRKRNSND